MGLRDRLTEKIRKVIKISSYGQVTIPKKIMKDLGMEEGDELLLITSDGEIILRKQ